MNETIRAILNRMSRRVPPANRPDRPSATQTSASIIVTAYNEGQELGRTIESLSLNTKIDHEIIVVDDGSTDCSCNAASKHISQLVRHSQRVGVAESRLEATFAAKGDVFVYFDAHQRVSVGCIDRVAALASRTNSIVWPDVCGFRRNNRILHGAEFELSNDSGIFSARWNLNRPRRTVTRITALRAPGYAIPRSIYSRVCWVKGLRNWGGSEAAVSLKAFFTGVSIFHLRGPVAWHRFKQSFHYDVSWQEVWRNHALIARVCFDDKTWKRYWFPEIFEPNLSITARQDVESPDVLRQHEEFQAMKVRTDREFWTELLRCDVPPALR